MNPQYKIAVLGATGAVGQKFVQLLDKHPWFETSILAASERSAGKKYKEAANWIGSTPIPASIASKEVVACEPGFEADIVFSGLDSSVAGTLESQFAEAGYPVISNAKNYRMHPLVPLLIPEVNPDHTALIKEQEWGGSGGYIVTNPNCSTVGLVCALKPLYDAFGIEAVQVTTMQALSGAGYPGVSSLDILGNVVPYIGDEEDKLVHEPNKLLGTFNNGVIEKANIKVSAQCNRVPVLDGHMECVSLKLRKKATVSEVKDALAQFKSPLAELGLPSYHPFIHLFEEERFPQPRRHANLGEGFTVSVGRVRECEVLDFKFVVLSHNTVRGAAGGAILNAELLVKQGYFE